VLLLGVRKAWGKTVYFNSAEGIWACPRRENPIFSVVHERPPPGSDR